MSHDKETWTAVTAKRMEAAGKPTFPKPEDKDASERWDQHVADVTKDTGVQALTLALSERIADLWPTGDDHSKLDAAAADKADPIQAAAASAILGFMTTFKGA